MTFLTEDGDRADRGEPKGKSGRHALSIPLLELVLSALIIVGIGTIVFMASIKPQLDHQRWFVRVQGSIRKLAPMTPPGASREQWANAVAWTLNAHANCCSRPEFLKSRDKAELQRFAEQLDRRLRDPVNLKTIDWIWDEFERISKYGTTYSDEWRPGRGVHQQVFVN